MDSNTNKFPFLRIEFHGGIFAGFFDNSTLPRMTNKVYKFFIYLYGNNRQRQAEILNLAM